MQQNLTRQKKYKSLLKTLNYGRLHKKRKFAQVILLRKRRKRPRLRILFFKKKFRKFVKRKFRKRFFFRKFRAFRQYKDFCEKRFSQNIYRGSWVFKKWFKAKYKSRKWRNYRWRDWRPWNYKIYNSVNKYPIYLNKKGQRYLAKRKKKSLSPSYLRKSKTDRTPVRLSSKKRNKKISNKKIAKIIKVIKKRSSRKFYKRPKIRVRSLLNGLIRKRPRFTFTNKSFGKDKLLIYKNLPFRLRVTRFLAKKMFSKFFNYIGKKKLLQIHKKIEKKKNILKSAQINSSIKVLRKLFIQNLNRKNNELDTSKKFGSIKNIQQVRDKHEKANTVRIKKKMNSKITTRKN